MQAAINQAGYGHLINIKAEKEANKTIEAELKKDAKREERTIRILVLGTGDSGKSTFIKQMMITHLEKSPFLPSQILSFKNSLRLNVVESLAVICKHFLKNKENKDSPLEKEAKAYEKLKQDPTTLTPALAKDITKFWANQSVKNVYINRGDIQIHTSTPYYLENCERFADSNFTPNTTDIIMCRERTSGVHETEIQAEGLIIRFIDVGGQKAERRKWLDHFSNCTLVIYVTALDSYCRVLEEDGKTSRLKDSIGCLRDISGNKHLKPIPFQIFLNKHDIFQEVWGTPKGKIQDFFPDCKAKSQEEGIAWISEQFQKDFKGAKWLPPITTNVLDPKNIGKIWAVCRDIFMKNAMQSGGDMI